MLIDNNTLKRMHTEIKTNLTLDEYIYKSRLLDKFIDMCINYDRNNINEKLCSKFEEYQNDIEQIKDEFDRKSYEGNYFYFRNIGKIDAFIKVIYIITKREYSEEWYKNLIDLKILEPIDYEELAIEGVNDIDNLFSKFKEILKEGKEKEEVSEIVAKLGTGTYKNYIPFLYSYFIINNDVICKQSEEAELDNTLYNKYLNKIFISILEIVLSQEDLINKYFINKNINIKKYLENITNSYIEFKQTNDIITYIPASVYNTRDLRSMNTFAESAYLPQSFTEIIENENLHKIRLTGYAGVGKTTTLKYLQNLDAEKYLDKIDKEGLAFYDDNEKIPVLIGLIDVKEKKPFKDIILENLGLRISNENKDLLNYMIRKNKISLYIDGIDEIKFDITNVVEHNDAKRAFISEVQAMLLSPEFNNINIIITDRDSNRNSITLNADEYTISGLTIQDVCKFVEQNTVDLSNLNEEQKKQAEDKINNIKNRLFSTQNNDLKYSEEAIEKYAFGIDNIKPLFLRQLLTILYDQSPNEPLPDKKDLNIKYLDTLIEREIKQKENKLAKYIVGSLQKMIEQNGSEFPQGEYKVLSAFFEYFNLEDTKEQLQKDNLNPDTRALLNLIIRMGIMVRVDAQNYDFKYNSYIDKFMQNKDLLDSFLEN